LRQVHGEEILVFRGREEEAGDWWEREGDALLTCSTGIAIGVFTADCLPLLLFEADRRVAAAVHAGWRGTAKELSRKVVEKMAEVFACNAERIQVALGPCIGPCCYEVDRPVEAEFRGGGLPWESFASSRGPGKWSLDLQKANIHLLLKSGVKKENIHLLPHCTACRSDLFFSYRREKGTRGRHLNFISLL
jgi:YfiH family protein